jgi:hypothetical protein
MLPPIFAVCAASAAVTALLGTAPTRLYPFGEAPQGVALPYAVWQGLPGGGPLNHLGDRPDMDQWLLQVDVYARTVADATAVVEALRDAIEPHAYITRWGTQETDRDTGHRRLGFDVSWHRPR